MIHVSVNHGALGWIGYQKYRYIGIPNSNYINQLFPFDKILVLIHCYIGSLNILADFWQNFQPFFLRY